MRLLIRPQVNLPENTPAETLSKPSCLQATRPASMFHPLSQIVPQLLLKRTSILPVNGLLPAIRNAPSVKTLREKRTRYQLIYDLIELSTNYSIARSWGLLKVILDCVGLHPSLYLPRILETN